MRKMGNFKGIPVFTITDPFEWQNIKDNHSYEEKIYVYMTNVYYKENLIAVIDGNTLLDFKEDLFNKLRNKTCDAETRPQEEEKPVSETVETAGGTSSIDEFMSSWREKIDNEIAMLKSCVAQMEESTNEVS